MPRAAAKLGDLRCGDGKVAVELDAREVRGGQKTCIT